jgi:hypothetical protein
MSMLSRSKQNWGLGSALATPHQPQVHFCASRGIVSSTPDPCANLQTAMAKESLHRDAFLCRVGLLIRLGTVIILDVSVGRTPGFGSSCLQP